MRSMTKSPLDLVKMALSVGNQGLSLYSCPVSRKDFTQPQLFALLVLRQFFQAGDRQTVLAVAAWTELQEAVCLRNVLHWTALENADSLLFRKGCSCDGSMSAFLAPAGVAFLDLSPLVLS